MKRVIFCSLILCLLHSSSGTESVKPAEDKIITITDDGTNSLLNTFDSFTSLFNSSNLGLDLFGLGSTLDGSTSSVPLTTALLSVGSSFAGAFGLFVLPLQVANQVLAIVAIAMLIAVYANSVQKDDPFSYATLEEGYDTYANDFFSPLGDIFEEGRSLANPALSSALTLLESAIKKYAQQ